MTFEKGLLHQVFSDVLQHIVEFFPTIYPSCVPTVEGNINGNSDQERTHTTDGSPGSVFGPLWVLRGKGGLDGMDVSLVT